jgi:hypothetical protein
MDIRKLADAWQDPAWAGVFMVAYFVLSLVTGASISLGLGPASLSGWLATAFLAWRVTDGGRISRMLLIVLSWASFIFAVVLTRTGLSVAEFCTLVASAVQIALLLSPAGYERTRREYGRTPLWRTREPGWLAIAFAVGVVLGLAWVVVYATAFSGHDKAGPFHGGPGTATAVFGIVFLISLAGLTLPSARGVPRWSLPDQR